MDVICYLCPKFKTYLANLCLWKAPDYAVYSENCL